MHLTAFMFTDTKGKIAAATQQAEKQSTTSSQNAKNY